MSIAHVSSAGYRKARRPQLLILASRRAHAWIELVVRLRQIRFAKPAQQRGHVDVRTHTLNVHADRNRPRDSNHRPIARVRQIEFDAGSRHQRGFAVLAVAKHKRRRIAARIPRQNQAQ